MLKELKQQSNLTLTENQGVAYRSTYSHCLDFFATCGSLRHETDRVIINKFIKAYEENPDYAMKLLFYARDIRGGLGERRLFNTVILYLCKKRPESVIKNLKYFSKFGRFDDILTLLDTKCQDALGEYIRSVLETDLKNLNTESGISLLAKWLPSVNTSSKDKKEQAKKICRLLGMKERDYRKMLSALRKKAGIIENSMRIRDYSFDYSAVPSKAMFKYRKSFYKNDKERYAEYISAVNNGKAKMNASVIYPYEIVHSIITENQSCESLNALDTIWKNLPFCTDNRNALAVIDGSASMYSCYGASVAPISVAISLGIYFAERSKGAFANHFITFSKTPRLIEIMGDSIGDKVEYCMSYNEIANTDIYQVFMLILLTAIKNNLDKSELPEVIYIISDMEFDKGACEDKTVLEDAKEKFLEYGYILPQIIYWNVCARGEHFPVTMNENGVGLVSGWSQNIFSMVESQTISPFSLMEKVINDPRYKEISA